MWNIVLTLSLLAMFFLSGCNSETEVIPIEKAGPTGDAWLIKLKGHGDYNVETTVIDDCEYLITHVENGLSMAHKGNCQFCYKRSH